MKREGDTLRWDSESQRLRCEEALNIYHGFDAFVNQFMRAYGESRHEASDWWKKLGEFCKPGERAEYYWPERKVLFRPSTEVAGTDEPTRPAEAD